MYRLTNSLTLSTLYYIFVMKQFISSYYIYNTMRVSIMPNMHFKITTLKWMFSGYILSIGSTSWFSYLCVDDIMWYLNPYTQTFMTIRNIKFNLLFSDSTTLNTWFELSNHITSWFSIFTMSTDFNTCCPTF